MSAALAITSCSDESKQIGMKNLIVGLWTMGAFMFLGFVLVYLRDFAPNAAEWAAQYGIGMCLLSSNTGITEKGLCCMHEIHFKSNSVLKQNARERA